VQQAAATLPSTRLQLSSAPGATACIYSGPVPFVTALRSLDLRFVLEVTPSGLLHLVDASRMVVWSNGVGRLGSGSSTTANSSAARSTGTERMSPRGPAGSHFFAPTAGSNIRVSVPPSPVPSKQPPPRPRLPPSGNATRPPLPAALKAARAKRRSIMQFLHKAATAGGAQFCIGGDGSLSVTAGTSGQLMWSKPAPAGSQGERT
jgi:hypothetical protein